MQTTDHDLSVGWFMNWWLMHHGMGPAHYSLPETVHHDSQDKIWFIRWISPPKRLIISELRCVARYISFIPSIQHDII